jgi:hypothetical protein
VDEEPAPDEALSEEESPVDGSPPDGIPGVVLAAIKDRMHARRLTPADDPAHLEASLGTPDDDVHVVDDGPEHCTIGRPVGHAPDGCVYVLVGRITRYGYEQLRDGDVEPAHAFSDARDISLCAVYEIDGHVENIALVRHFRRPDDVPADYLPPAPFLEFSDDEFPTEEDLPADGDSPTTGPARAGLWRRAFATATGAARRAGMGRQGKGFPPYESDEPG